MKSQPNITVLGTSCFEGMAASMRLKNLVDSLISKNHITVNNIIYEKDAIALPEKFGKLNNINYCVIGFRRANPFSPFIFIWQGLKFIKKTKCKSQKNILYHYDQPDLRSIIFLFYAKLTGYRIVLDIIEDNRYYTKFPRLLTKINIKSSIFFIKHLNFYADGILAISQHLYDQMDKLSKGKVPVYLIPITVNLTNFEKKIYKIPENFKIFYGGSFAEKDGLEYLIKAFERVSLSFENINLILTGKGTDQNMKYYHKLINKSFAKEKIKMMGYLESREYYRKINECDLYCMTRVNSNFANAGFPFKLGEYLATGKAVIATSVGDVPKYLQNKKNAILINQSSVDEIAEALMYLLKNPEQINLLGIEGRIIAEKYFDSEKVGLEFLKIVSSV